VFTGTIEYLLPVLAAALLSAREPQSIRYGIAYIVAGLLAGMITAYATTGIIIVALLAQIYLSLLGLMVLLDLHPPARIVNLFRFLAGGLVGLQFGISPIGSPLSEPALTLGFLLSAVSLYTVAGFFSMRSRADWQRIAIRIAGSWIVAIAVIYIAYLIKRIW
jgi:hypothetical protein